MWLRSAVVGVALIAAACDKVPLTAPTNSTITLSASSRAVGINDALEISAMVLESGGTPVQNGTTVRFTTNLGTLDPVEAQTRNGIATTMFRAGAQSGVAQIRATSGAAGGAATGTGATASTSNQIEINVGAAAAGTLTLSTSAPTVPASGGSAIITAVVTDTGGNRVAGVPVTFTTTAGTLSSSSANTNASGEATVTLTTSRTATVTARVGAGDTARTGTVTITAASSTIALAFEPAAPTVGQVVRLTITPTIPTGGAAPRVTVNWGDGTIEDIGVVPVARTVTHIYNAAGTFSIAATGTADGDTFTSGTTVIVTARPAVAVNIGVAPPAPTAGQTVTLTANVTGAEAGAILRYEWVVSNADTGAVLQTQTTTGNQFSIIATGGTPYAIRVTAFANDGRTGVGATQFRVP